MDIKAAEGCCKDQQRTKGFLLPRCWCPAWVPWSSGLSRAGWWAQVLQSHLQVQLAARLCPSQPRTEDTDRAVYLTARWQWHLTTPTCNGAVSVTRSDVAHNLTQPIPVHQSLSQSAHTNAPVLWIYSHTCTLIHRSLKHHHPLSDTTLIAFQTFEPGPLISHPLASPARWCLANTHELSHLS